MTADAHLVEDQSAVFAFLADPATHGGPVTRIDTHGAVVVLAGPVAYKAKRAVRFPFMDYSTLEKRRAACEAEVAVNAAHAPGIYRGVVAITRGPDGRLALGGPGEPVEWAVVMRRFDEAATLDRVADRGGLTPAVVAALATAVAAAHEAAPVREAGPFLAALGAWLGQNRAALAESPELFDPAAATALCDAHAAALERLAPLVLARGRAGRVRRCHGDLHLRNLALLDGVPTPFDAIEFDETIATGDVLYDLAFLLMDLVERGHAAEANVVLNRYLWLSDACDLEGLAALPLYLSVRAVIRAKVVAAGIAALPDAARPAAAEEARRYFAAARAFLAPAPARLVAVGGLSGTGKSTLAAALAPGLGRLPGAIHLRTDIERKRLFGVTHTQRLGADAYTPEASAAVYAVLRDKAATALAAGFAVVADAVHARAEERAAIARVAAVAGVPFHGLWLEAPAPVLLARVEARTGDASDADATVVQAQARYVTSPADWPRLSAGGDAAAVLAAARAALATSPPGTSAPLPPFSPPGGEKVPRRSG